MSNAEPISSWDAFPLGQPVHWKRDFILPLATIGLLVLMALTIGVHFGVQALNEESAAREQQLVRNGLAQRMEEVAELVVPQLSWDDAISHLDNRFDLAWARSNVHEFLEHAYGFDGEYVIDAADRPVFGALGADEVPPGSYARIAEPARDLLRAVRKQEAVRGPLARKAGTEMISKPIQASTVEVVGGELTILTATLVQPDFGTALPAGPRSPIVVTLMHVDKPFLAKFSGRFLLDDVSVRLPGQAQRQGRIEWPVTDDSGEVQAWLAWKPLDPGYGMLHRMWLPVLQGLLVIMGIAAIQLRRMLLAARQLIEREEFAYEMAFEPLPMPAKT
jgi:hypothetical protein